ncbi:hypothetical protein [Prescottella equi]|uniref:hypothetical protein n=1 Tax=Rhodococcus hoagii TaxID=43767 RepID=UPI001C75E90B|nr:hypothetical protein [Prescottella equi]BCN45262.1 hypothetical protein RE9414_35420 [Prescottella equi]
MIDTNEWLAGIAKDESLGKDEFLAAVALMSDGNEIDVSGNEAAIRLQLAGYLRPVAIDGDEYTYELTIPGAVAA